MSSVPSSPSWASTSPTSSDHGDHCHSCEHQPKKPKVEIAPAKVRELIRAKYDAGVPLFTKKQLRDLAEQMDKHKHDNKPGDLQAMNVGGLDGEYGVFLFEIGHEVPAPEPGTKAVVMHTALRYNSIEALLERKAHKPGFHYLPAYATWYSPVEIAMATETRDAATGKVLQRPYSLPVGATCHYAALRRRFENECAHGRENHLVDDLCKLLAAHVESEAVAKVSKVVAFACGRMAWAGDEHDMATVRSVAQHVLVLEVRKSVADARRRAASQASSAVAGAREEDGVKCYVQDPVYTDADKRLLLKKGVTLLEDPRGFLEVDDDSVVISISPTVPVRQIVADIAKPMVLIWDRGVEVEENGVFCTDPASKRVEDMMKGYIELPWFPAEEGCLNTLAVYVRKDAFQGEA